MNDTDIDIANQPHAVCFRDDGGTLTHCYGFGEFGSIHPRYAIFANRSDADAALVEWKARSTVYFTVPAKALFNVETVMVPSYNFTLKA